jgi:hypothetical protein
MLQKIDSDVCSSHEETFHLNGITQPPQEIIDHKQDMTEVNMWCGMIKDQVIATFSFRKQL